MIPVHPWSSPSLARAVVCSLVLFVAAPPVVFGQDGRQAPAQSGHRLAQRLCAGCHVIDPEVRDPVPAGLATFRGIANKPGQTGQKIMDALIAPGHPMPDMHLSIQEIADIIAYLETLRTDRSIPPLIGPTTPTIKSDGPTRL